MQSIQAGSGLPTSSSLSQGGTTQRAAAATDKKASFTPTASLVSTTSAAPSGGSQAALVLWTGARDYLELLETVYRKADGKATTSAGYGLDSRADRYGAAPKSDRGDFDEDGGYSLMVVGGYGPVLSPGGDEPGAAEIQTDADRFSASDEARLIGIKDTPTMLIEIWKILLEHENTAVLTRADETLASFDSAAEPIELRLNWLFKDFTSGRQMDAQWGAGEFDRRPLLNRAAVYAFSTQLSASTKSTLADRCIDFNPWLLKFLPAELRTKARVEAAIRKAPVALAYGLLNQMNSEDAESVGALAFCKQPRAYPWLPRPLKTAPNSLAAVHTSARLLRYVPLHDLSVSDRELVLSVVIGKGHLLESVLQLSQYPFVPARFKLPVRSAGSNARTGLSE